MEATRGRNSAVRSNCGHNRQCVRACVAVGAVFAGVEELALKTKTSLDWVAIERTTTTWGGTLRGQERVTVQQGGPAHAATVSGDKGIRDTIQASRG
jgi:hypothetical protein